MLYLGTEYEDVSHGIHRAMLFFAANSGVGVGWGGDHALKQVKTVLKADP